MVANLQLLEVEAGAEDSLDSLNSRGTGAEGELAEVNGHGGEHGDPIVSDRMQGAEFEALKAWAEAVSNLCEG